MSREDTVYDEDAFDAAVNDEDYSITLGSKEAAPSKQSPLVKRRMIESLLEERALRRQLDDHLDFDED